MKNAPALSAAAIALLITSLSAHAAYVVDLTQVADASQPLGFDVVANGSGTIDTIDLSLNSTIGIDTGIGPIGANMAIGTFGSADIYTGITGPRVSAAAAALPPAAAPETSWASTAPIMNLLC